MGDTKEAILTTALQLFASDGYEAVSVSQIAGALGMTKGALYKHYKNKRDIFDHILIRMEQRDAEQAGNCEMPEEYRAHADDFFYYSDHHNCERIYQEMIKYQDRKEKR